MSLMMIFQAQRHVPSVARRGQFVAVPLPDNVFFVYVVSLEEPKQRQARPSSDFWENFDAFKCIWITEEWRERLEGLLSDAGLSPIHGWTPPSEEPERDPEEDALRRTVSGFGIMWGFRVESDLSIEGLTVPEGSFLIRATYRNERVPYEQVPRSCFLELSKVVTENAVSCVTVGGSVARLRSYLTDGRALSGRDDTSPILVIRPLHSGVSRPVQATSDDAAIFELLTSVGGRMPEED